MEAFLRFLAINVLLSNLDSFLGGAQNYYVYLEPQSNQLELWPWDMDHSFGAFELVGSRESRCNLSIHHPHWGGNELIERVLAVPRHRDYYHDYLETCLNTLFSEEKLHKQIAEAAQFLRPLIAANARDGSAGALDRFDRIVADRRQGNRIQALKPFVTERRVSVRRQLSGSSEGKALRMNTMPHFKGWIVASVVIVVALLFNAGVFLWAVVAGFRGSIMWGVLNVFFYPVAPIIYGFQVRKDLGRRSAIAALLGFVFFVTALIYALSR